MTKREQYHLPQFEAQNSSVLEGVRGVADFQFLVRERDFSLDFRAIRSSKLFGAKRKVVLRGEAYEWAPVLRVFDKLREVGVSSYLVFTLCLSVFMIFESIEDFNGYLIGLKTLDRID